MDKKQDLVKEEVVRTGKIKFKDINDLMSFSYGCFGLLIFILLSVLSSIL